jgi:hypothetical protein
MKHHCPQPFAIFPHCRNTTVPQFLALLFPLLKHHCSAIFHIFPITETPLSATFRPFPITETSLFQNSSHFPIAETPLSATFRYFPIAETTIVQQFFTIFFPTDETTLFSNCFALLSVAETPTFQHYLSISLALSYYILSFQSNKSLIQFL